MKFEVIAKEAEKLAMKLAMKYTPVQIMTIGMILQSIGQCAATKEDKK